MNKPSLWACALHVLIITYNQNEFCDADVDSGCPSWGCLPWGSFSLSAGIPSTNSSVPWRVELPTVTTAQDDARVPRGCVSDQQSVVCTTPSGYISIDPTNGKTLWSYTTMAPPYLPIMDIYGDVIGIDAMALYYIGADGKPKHPIDVAILKPMYSLMVANDSIVLLTASTNKTAQIVTYLTDGIVDASLPLTGSIERMNGTFIPFSQPIIAGFRAYLMTYFLPDRSGTTEADEVTGMLRLYAIDILHQMAPRLVIAWYFNFGRWDSNSYSSRGSPNPFSRQNDWNNKNYQNVLEPIVTYFGGNIYVNVPGSLGSVRETSGGHVHQPYPGSLWAIRDDGNGGSLLFRTSCFYGPMAVYDTYDKPLTKQKKTSTNTRGEEERLLWIMNRSPAMIQGFDTRNGTVKEIKGFDTIFQKLNGWITSSLSITRSKASPNNDQLVLGTADSTTGQASVSVVEVSDGQAKLVLSRVVSTNGLHSSSSSTSSSSKSTHSQASGASSSSTSQSLVEGQIVNFAFYPPNGKKWGIDDKDVLKLGLAAMIKESNSTHISRTVVGIF